MANPYDLFTERGFIYQSTDEAALREAFAAGPVTAYVGYDLTASSLHIGSLVSIMMLAHLQREGHAPIALVGGGTTRIGDPSGKTEMRKMLTGTRIDEFKQGIKANLAQFLTFGDGAGEARMVDNADWLLSVNYVEFLREVGRHFSVNRMLTAESVQQRLEKGLSFLEFSYQILQAYDFVELYREYGCTLQMGGADQWGNIVAGIDLAHKLERVQLYGLTAPLVTTSTGEKMGKTASGAVWLDADLMSPYEFYQYWINVTDADVQKFLALFTFLPMDEVKRLGSLRGAECRDAKKVLATEVTRIVHGDEAAAEARKATDATFGGAAGSEGVPIHEIDPAQLDAGIPAFILFSDAGLLKSRGEARRKVKEGGCYCNGTRIPTFDHPISTTDLVDGRIELRFGKKNFRHIIPKQK